MKHQIYNLFQGTWWGGIVGQEMVAQVHTISRHNWWRKRQEIAEIMLQSEGLTADNPDLQSLIQQMFGVSGGIDNLAQATNPSMSLDPAAKNSIKVVLTNQEAETRLLNHNYNLLSLLPLIIFFNDDSQLLSQIIGKYILKSADLSANSEMSEDLLIWSHLVTLVLNNGFQLRRKNLIRASDDLLGQIGVRETLLIEKLKSAIQAAHDGVGVHQLLRKISSGGNIRQIAIALAWYCLITTPNDCRLSIQRSLHLQPSLAQLTAALTGTLSGAYNGLTGIPWSWRSQIVQNPNFFSENEILLKLFKNWLGIYSIDSQDSHKNCYEQELCAVATPQLIQYRKNLQIISQKSLY